jgi:hypothetical protein
MAHRHKMQARGRRTIYAGAGSNVAKEAGDTSDDKFKRGGHQRGGAVVGRAFGGAVKGRADKRKRGGSVSKGFAKGGSVWSHAGNALRGQKAMAAPVMKPGKLHDEMHDNTVRTMGDHSAGARTGHGGKAKHQLQTGGRVPRARGGPACKEEGEGEKAGEDDKEEDPGYAYGGVTTFKRGGKLKMHYVGGGGSHHRHAEGGAVEDEDDKPRMAKGGGCWMEKAFAGSHGQFKAKAKKAGMSTEKYASKEADSPSASTRTKRQANLAKLGAKYGGG